MTLPSASRSSRQRSTGRTASHRSSTRGPKGCWIYSKTDVPRRESRYTHPFDSPVYSSVQVALPSGKTRPALVHAVLSVEVMIWMPGAVAFYHSVYCANTRIPYTYRRQSTSRSSPCTSSGRARRCRPLQRPGRHTQRTCPRRRWREGT